MHFTRWRERVAAVLEVSVTKQIKENSGERRSRGEYIFYFTAALLSGGLLVYAWRQPWAYMRTGDGLSLATFPTIFAATIFVVSTTGALLEMRQKEGSKLPTKEGPFLFWPVILLSGLAVAGTFGFWNFDAVITSTALVLLLLLAGGVRDWRLLVGMSIGMGLLIYILFIWVLGVYFPHGWFR